VTEYYIKTTGWTKFSAVHTEIMYSYSQVTGFAWMVKESPLYILLV